MESYRIYPYVGIGDLKFGMNRTEVAGVVGKPEVEAVNKYSGVSIEYRLDSALQTAYDTSTGLLVLVSVYAPIAGVSLLQRYLDWDKSANWYEMLRKTDPSARQTVGISIFFQHGISTAGLEGVERSEKSVTVFASGQWLEDDPELARLD